LVFTTTTLPENVTVLVHFADHPTTPVNLRGITEVVYELSAYTAYYVARSTIAGVAGVYTFSMVRAGGWVGAYNVRVEEDNDFAGGDLGGSYPNPEVLRLRGFSLAATAPAGGQYLAWNGTAWEALTPPDALPPSGVANGDLSGTYPSPAVVKIQGRAVALTAPTSAQVLAWNSGTSSWTPTSPAVALPPNGAASGDLSGSYPSPAVAKLQGFAVASATPTSGQLLAWNSGTSAWTATTLASSFPPNGAAGGDLSGTYPNPTVGKLQNVAVITGTPSNGQVLTYVAANSRWEALTVASSFPPNGAASGDLSGSYPSPAVAKLQGFAVATATPTSGQILTWNAGTSAWTATTLSALPPNGAASGDLSGSYPSPTVGKLQGVSVLSGTPSNGQVLTYVAANSRWEATSPTVYAAASVAYNFPILTISAATTIVGSTHRGNKIRSTGANNAACVFTVQRDADDATFGVGDYFVIRWSGVGQPSVAAGTGVTINDNSKLKVASAGDEITVQKVAANTYEIGGARAT
jgi:hypothetical protein